MSLGVKIWIGTLVFNSKISKIMKNLFNLIIVLFMSANFTSCTPESIVGEAAQSQDCCGDDIPIPPPPPPPPNDEGVTGE